MPLTVLNAAQKKKKRGKVDLDVTRGMLKMHFQNDIRAGWLSVDATPTGSIQTKSASV